MYRAVLYISESALSDETATTAQIDEINKTSSKANKENDIHGVLAHSKDGINWLIDDSPKAYTKTIKWNNGKTIKQAQLERPFVFVENGKPTHIFFATMDGPGGFGNGTKTWNMVIPLKDNQ